MEIKPTKLEQVFIDSYLDEAWFAHHEGLENGEDYEFLKHSTVECMAFILRVKAYLDPSLYEQAGHDFWLTRNGHGSGFWDRGTLYDSEGKTGLLLSEEAEDFGPVSY
tara:strand:+ start:107 stop:430 length:324 start_codon:yes stop_codon:yes gene_type:complete